MLFQPPSRLTQRAEDILTELDLLKQEVAFSFSPRRWFGSLRRLTTAKAIRASIGIAGLPPETGWPRLLHPSVS